MTFEKMFSRFSYYTSVLLVIAFGIITIIASGGGSDRDDENKDEIEPAPPLISDLKYSPRSVIINSGEGEITISVSLEWWDEDADISNINISVFDSSDNLINTYNKSIDGAGSHVGTTDAEILIDSTILDTYSFNIYATDATNLESNILTGYVSVNDCWKIKATLTTETNIHFFGMKVISLDGKIYCWETSEILIYDTILDSWEKLSPPSGRYYFALEGVNGKIYVIGGTVMATSVVTGMVEAYDPATGTWETRSAMPTPRESLSTAVINGKIYTIGGYDTDGEPLDVVEEYDPVTDTWGSKSPTPTERSEYSVEVVNGKIYVFGGFHQDSFLNIIPVNVVEEYDPATDIWATKTPIPDTFNYSEVEIVNGKMYFIGGYVDNTDLEPLDVVEEYDPENENDPWEIKSSMPTARSDFSTVVLNDKIYAFGGANWIDFTGYMDVVEEYDPTTDTWATKTPMPEGNYLVAVSENNKIYIIIVGYTVLEYDPSKDQGMP